MVIISYKERPLAGELAAFTANLSETNQCARNISIAYYCRIIISFYLYDHFILCSNLHKKFDIVANDWEKESNHANRN